MRQKYKNHKLKMISPTWNDEFELRDISYSVSDIEDYIGYVIKNIAHYPLVFLFIFTSTELVLN